VIRSRSFHKLSRTIDKVAENNPSSIVDQFVCYGELTTRALGNTKPARPYIDRLISWPRRSIVC
jgi:hypothetical protein